MAKVFSFIRYTRVQRDYARWTWRRDEEAPEVVHCMPVREPDLHWFLVIEPPRYRTKNLIRVRRAAP